MNNFLFVCQRCQKRLEKKNCHVAFEWTEESFKEMKMRFRKESGQKPNPRVVLTSCLGPCPEEAVTLMESRDGQMQEAQKYSFELEKDEIYKKVFRSN